MTAACKGETMIGKNEKIPAGETPAHSGFP